MGIIESIVEYEHGLLSSYLRSYTSLDAHLRKIFTDNDWSVESEVSREIIMLRGLLIDIGMPEDISYLLEDDPARRYFKKAKKDTISAYQEYFFGIIDTRRTEYMAAVRKKHADQESFSAARRPIVQAREHFGEVLQQMTSPRLKETIGMMTFIYTQEYERFMVKDIYKTSIRNLSFNEDIVR